MTLIKKKIPVGSMFSDYNTTNDIGTQRWVIIGQTNSGKTWSLAYALEHWIPRHDEYIIICPTWESQKIYPYIIKILENKSTCSVSSLFSVNFIESCIFKQQQRTKWDVNKTVCLILDDVLACKGIKGSDATGLLEQIYALGRHHKISCFTLLQKITAVSTTVRNNASLIMFKSVNDYEIRTAYNTSGFGNLSTFKEALENIWSVERRPYIFRVSDGTFYCGWDMNLAIQAGSAGTSDEIISSDDADNTLNQIITKKSTQDQTQALQSDTNLKISPELLVETIIPPVLQDDGAGAFPRNFPVQ